MGVYNRSDCCKNRLKGFKVIISDGNQDVWTFIHSGKAPDGLTSISVPNVSGDMVEVMVPGNDKILSLAEVEVFGEMLGPTLSDPTASPTSKPNLALGKPTIQSNTSQKGFSS